MCSCKNYDAFWSNLEKDINQSLPEVVKNILKTTGFDSEICLKNTTSDDILNIEDCIDKNKVQWAQKYSKLYGPYSKKSKFKLLPGHSKIIFEISEHFKRKAVTATWTDQQRDNRVKPVGGYVNDAGSEKVILFR